MLLLIGMVCQEEGFKSPDDGDKALQGYEIEYCGWDED